MHCRPATFHAAARICALVLALAPRARAAPSPPLFSTARAAAGGPPPLFGPRYSASRGLTVATRARVDMASSVKSPPAEPTALSLLLGAPAYVARRICLELGVLALFARHALLDGARSVRSPVTFALWLNELRVVVALERERRLDVLAAGGAAAVAAEPWRLLRPHRPPLSRAWSRPWTWLRPRARGAGGAMGGGGAPVPILKELVLIGGGHSHVHVLRSWGMRPLPGVRLTLITRDVETPYSGMLPGHVAGQYSRDDCHIDLVRLAAFAGARLLHAEARGIDTVGKRVHLSGGRPSLRYDVLSINIGCTPRLYGAAASGDDLARAGGSDGVTAVKPIDGFGRRWDELLAHIVDAAGAANADASPATIAIVGAGGGGVELALAVHARINAELRARGEPEPAARARVLLVGRATELMPSHSPPVRAAVAAALRARGIRVELGTSVVGYDGAKRQLVLGDGRRLRADESIWCTEGAAQGWLATSGLPLDASGFVRVSTALAAVGHADVFAAGDVASIDGHPRPKSGVFAVRMGPPLERNLRAALLGQPLVEYVPQASFLGLIGTGDGSAIASRGSLALRETRWLWELKDWIDVKWMHGYADGLPQMGATDGEARGPAGALAAAAGAEALALLAHAPMRCGGCGAKVGATVLSNAMARLSPPTRPELLAGVHAADDCAVWEDKPGGHVSVHTVDYFRAFVSDPFELGRIAAVHALSDCHAMGAQPQVALAHVTLPLQVSASAEDELVQLMAGACTALAEAGCALGGGHTSEGVEAGIGFSITGGASSADELMRKGGLEEGQALILTKPIGTGVLFAALMRHAARGRWIASALASMRASNGAAARILRAHGARACTDVTGFGLCGHMIEMCKASGRAVTLELDAIPLLEGALECVAANIFSSLAPANMRLRHGLRSARTAEPTYALLFDPQTSGGLLAAVPAERAAACVAALRAAGCESAAMIGTVGARAAAADGPLVECV